MKRNKSSNRITLLTVLAALAVSVAVPASAELLDTNANGAAVPTVATFAKNGTVADVIHFSPEDFVVESGSLPLDSIILTALPDHNAGMLTVGGNELAVGDAVAMSAVTGLRFYPLATPTVASTSFAFTPVFSDGTSGGDVNVGLYLLTAENNAPIAENLTLSTYKNVAITEQFSATDPEGDLITFRLMDKPARGAVTLPVDGTTQFVYTPFENKTGNDKFTYVAVDAVGNVSTPATVKIKIEKASTKVTYADMSGVPAYRAAIRLAEGGILIGENMDGVYFFQPDLPMSRDQFVALAMNTVGLDALDGVSRTGFADDESIPTWAKPYVSSALKSGVVQGTATETGVVFKARDTITRAEATVLLNRLLRVTDVAEPTMFMAEEAAPAWAFQAAVNLETVGILRPNAEGAYALSDSLTRADAAEMLASALDVLDAREPSGWFHW